MIRALALAVALVAAIPAQSVAQSVDLPDLVNRLRAPGSRCAPAGRLAPYAQSADLNRAAESFARGMPVADSVKAAGYRAAALHAITLSGSTDPGMLEGVLLRNSCAAITNPGLAEIGVFRSGTTAWIVLAARLAPRVHLDADQVSGRVLALVNQARAEPRRCGNTNFRAARPVKANDALALASRMHAEDMARQRTLSHTGGDGSGPADRAARTGYDYRALAENIATGQETPEAAVASWITSPSHCANLMNPAYTETGAALAVDTSGDSRTYWAQLFAAPMK